MGAYAVQYGLVLSVVRRFGLLSFRYQRVNVSFISGIAILLIALSTLLQYISGADFGIDQFFVDHYITTNTPYPGRMSAITAMCFILASLVFILSVVLPRYHFTVFFIRAIGVMLCVVSMIAFIGYVRDIETAYRWFSNTSAMAAHTSVGFFLLGAGVVVLTISHVRLLSDSPFWLSGSIALFIVLLAIEWSQHIRAQENQLLSAAVTKELDFMRVHTIERVNSTLSGFRRMAQRWRVSGGTPQNEWREDAKNYINDLSSLTTLEWVGDTYHIRWVEPLAGNERVIGLYVAYDEERLQTLESAKRGGLTLSPPLDLVQGYQAIIAYAPLYINDRFDGFLVGIFDTQQFFSQRLSYLGDKNINVRITDGEKELFNVVSGTPVVNLSVSSDIITVYDRKWQITLAPTKKFAKKYTSSLPQIILFVGVLLALVVSLLAHFVMRYVLYNQRLIEKTSQLTENESKIRAILDNAFDGLITIDGKGIVQSYNTACYNMFGYTPEEVVGNNINMLMPQPYRREHDGYLHHYQKTGEKKIIGLNREVTGLKKNGDEFPLELSVSEISTENGKIYSGIIHDLSERKKSESELMVSAALSKNR